jgi:hypothetical protein
VKYRLRVYQLVTLLAVACVALVAAVLAWRYSADARPADLVERIPDGSAILYVDVKALRAAGLLDAFGGAAEDREPEYREFVQATGFNYESDLDAAVVGFQGPDRYVLLRGRFDWGQIYGYVRESGGICHNGDCRLRTRNPSRYLSLFAVTPRLMALAAASSPWAALDLRKNPRPEVADPVPSEPVWFRAPGGFLSQPGRLPDGLRPFASSLAGAEDLLLSIGPGDGAFEARLRVSCRSAAEASAMAAGLEKATQLLRRLIELEHQRPNPADLSGILTAGAFRAEDRIVRGRWPVPREFIDALAAPAR